MRVALLGGTGHLGAALRASAPPEAHLIVMGRGASSPNKFDVQSLTSLPEVDFVIGTFPLARVVQDHPDAHLLLARYIDVCAKARIIQLSTDAVFSGRRSLYREGDVPDAETPYGRAQGLVDATLVSARPDTLLVRTSFIFGYAGGRLDKRLAPLTSGALSIPDQLWAGNVYRSPTEVNFLATAIWRAIGRNCSGVFNACGQRLSIHQFFVEALRHLGFETFPEPVEQSQIAGRDTSLDPSLMQREIEMDEWRSWEWFRRYPKRPHD